MALGIKTAVDLADKHKIFVFDPEYPRKSAVKREMEPHKQRRPSRFMRRASCCQVSPEDSNLGLFLRREAL